MPISDGDRYGCWDVVIVPFPYTDRLAEKRRPALVVSGRELQTHGLLWIAMITSAKNERWSCDVPIANFASAGLPAPSVVRTAKIACIEPARVLRAAGQVDRDTASSVRKKVLSFLF
jgi:mRNA interferase MazF